MVADPIETLSTRRSHVRSRILLILASRGELQAGHLAQLAGIDSRRLRWAMHGKPPHYRVELALVRASLVEEVRRGRWLRYRITPSGRTVVRLLLRERRFREHGE
jgi:predicted transcriptional regulator with HTH domain